MAIDEAFNKTVEYYDQWIRRAVPGYDEVFAAAEELIALPEEDPVDILDLGAGTGLFSNFMRRRLPEGRFVLWDVAGKMLEVAQTRFRDNTESFSYIEGDYRSISYSEAFDLVISSLSIHHLKDEDKRDLFGRIYRSLRGRGVFINVDLVQGATPYLEDFYGRNWYRKMRESGASEEEVRAGIERRIAFDREASLEDQLKWLRDAGFRDVDCAYRIFKIGLFLAVK
jgi:tRNA (cmo5U34)-methyltransferase